MQTNETDLKTHRYITLNSGARFSYSNPGPFRLSDIAASLAKTARFRGHTIGFYSVAEHSVLVARLAELAGCGRDVQRAALMHDAHESYTGDVPSPLKWECPEFSAIEDRIELALRAALTPEIPPEVYAQVKRFDIWALHIEASTLFVPPPPWARPSTVSLPPQSLEWREAQTLFLEAALALGFTVE